MCPWRRAGLRHSGTGRRHVRGSCRGKTAEAAQTPLPDCRAPASPPRPLRGGTIDGRYLTQRNLAFRLNSKHSPVYLLAKSLKWRNNGIRNGRKLGTLYCRLARHQPGEEAFVRLPNRSEEHTSELQSRMHISYADLRLKK